MGEKPSKVGQRIVVTGMAGAGKSTFSKRLASKTGLPLIHLDLHIWNPGWIRVSDEDLLKKQHELLAAGSWIVDSNDVDSKLLLNRADTFIVIATPWWICSWRAFLRGLKRPPGSVLPQGCEESFGQRIKDEWGIVWRNWCNRKVVRDNDLALAARCRERMQVYVLVTKKELNDLIDAI